MIDWWLITFPTLIRLVELIRFVIYTSILCEKDSYLPILQLTFLVHIGKINRRFVCYFIVCIHTYHQSNHSIHASLSLFRKSCRDVCATCQSSAISVVRGIRPSWGQLKGVFTVWWLNSRLESDRTMRICGVA